MRFNPVTGTREQRLHLRRRFEELMEPETALAAIRTQVRPGDGLVRAACSQARAPGNRFVIRVDAETADGGSAAYALKGYVDERGEGIISLYRALLLDCEQRGEPCPAVQPLGYARTERLLFTPWLQGISLAEALRTTRSEAIGDALARAPWALAQLHASRIVPEAPTTARDMVQATMARWRHHFLLFPEVREPVTPLTDLLQATLPHLSSSPPTLVHGDPAPGNFILDGASWRLLDLDTYGYADPAYDVGYLLARLEHECMRLPAFHERAAELVAAMYRGCRAAMPGVPPGNVAFYYAMTLVRKVLSRYLRAQASDRDARWPQDVARVVANASGALQAVASGTSPPFGA